MQGRQHEGIGLGKDQRGRGRGWLVAGRRAMMVLSVGERPQRVGVAGGEGRGSVM